MIQKINFNVFIVFKKNVIFKIQQLNIIFIF